MAYLSVSITPDSKDGTKVYLDAVFSGGSESYTYAKQLRVTILGDASYTFYSEEESGGYNTWSETITGLDPGVTYAWSADMYVRVTGGWSVSDYSDNGTFTTTGTYEPTYYYAELSFDANGGSGAPRSIVGESAADEKEVIINIPSTEPTRPGYTFICWDLGQGSNPYAKYGGAGNGKTQSNPNYRYILAAYGTSSRPTSYTVTAVWEKVTYYYASLSFNANGGTGAPSKITGTSNPNTQEVSITIPSTTPTRDGYAFVCWDLGQGSNRYAKYGGTGDGTSINKPNKRYLVAAYSTNSSNPTPYTATAIWDEVNTGSVWVRNSSGAFVQGTPYVYSGGSWKPATAYICNGSTWQKCL